MEFSPFLFLMCTRASISYYLYLAALQRVSDFTFNSFKHTYTTPFISGSNTRSHHDDVLKWHLSPFLKSEYHCPGHHLSSQPLPPPSPLSPLRFSLWYGRNALFDSNIVVVVVVDSFIIHKGNIIFTLRCLRTETPNYSHEKGIKASQTFNGHN